MPISFPNISSIYGDYVYFNDKTQNMTNGNNTPRAMDIEQVREYTLSLYGVTEDQPFGDDNIVFRIEGKIFLCLWLGEDLVGALIKESYELGVSNLPKAVRGKYQIGN